MRPVGAAPSFCSSTLWPGSTVCLVHSHKRGPASTYSWSAWKVKKIPLLHWGHLQMKPETLIFWDPVFGAWLWTAWAPLMPSKLNLAALTRSILTIKFRNPTRPPQIMKPSSKKPVKCVKASVPWTITHLHGCSLRQIHLCYSIFYFPLSTLRNSQLASQVQK